MNETEIKAGQTWKTRNGLSVHIDETGLDNGAFPVRSGHNYWQANGRYWEDNYDHGKDLITLIK
ncbi:hypothetical protein [Dyadobacter sp. LHD-138]|uniref:hypothetical protein n=1 Tax=Dyadobacter sp. LHD-138 TaxID=3071413 RepID=UPI0027DEE632|nr:hypothetical protein [Dyadobacter sp. LHD-138]MDQ6479823.1 hypothetical protein [Dyadobacter sp. LHD-138]